MDDLYSLAPYLTALIAFLSTAYLFTRGPKEGRFDCVAPIIQTAVTVATLGIYLGLMKVNTTPLLWIPAAGLGGALGAYGSWSTTLELQPDGSIRTVRTMWYLAVLAASIGVSQIFIRHTAISAGMFHGGLAAFYFGTATAVASNVTLLARAASLKRTTLTDILAPVRAFDWRKNTEGSPWEKVRERLASNQPASGSAVGAPRPATAPSSATPRAAPPGGATATGAAVHCSNCGAAVRSRSRFCQSCGQPFPQSG